MRPPSTSDSLRLGGIYALLACLTYLVAVRTGIGQRLDLVAFEARKSQPVSLRQAITPWLTPIAVVATVALVALTAGAIARGSQSLGRSGRTLLGVAVATGAATLLKALLGRPELVDHSPIATYNTLPSGHAAGIMAVAIGIVGTPSSHRCRWQTTATDLGLVTFVVLLVGSGWHRPSDILAGLLVGAAAMAIITPRSPTEDPDATRPSRRLTLAITGLALAVAAALRNTPPDPRHNFLAHAVVLVVLITATSELLRHAVSTPGPVTQDEPRPSRIRPE